MQSNSLEQILKISKSKGFYYKVIHRSFKGKYKKSDSMYNHKDYLHFNNLHKNFSNENNLELIFAGETLSYTRFFKIFGLTFPLLVLLKDENDGSVLEITNFLFFQFLKLNKETDQDDGGCLSEQFYYVGCKHKLLFNLLYPFIKKIIISSYEGFEKEDVAHLNRRDILRKNCFSFTNDNESKNNYTASSDIYKQNCFFKKEKEKNSEPIFIELNNIINNEFYYTKDFSILSFQIYKKDEILKIYPLTCPHQGGYLGLNNEIGAKFDFDNFKSNGEKVRCNVHNRRFEPIVSINLNDKNKSYESNFFKFEVTEKNLNISLKEDLFHQNVIDWTK